jgi:hypothetical protein
MRRALCLSVLVVLATTVAQFTQAHAPVPALAKATPRATPPASLLGTHATLLRPPAPLETQLRCTPGRLRRGDTLTLALSAPHGGYLAIVNPRGKYFFITSDDAGAQAFEHGAGVNPQLSATAFSRMNELRLSTADTKAIDYDSKAAARRAETVFRQTGWYRVLVGAQSFERSEPSPDSACRVYYVNEGRKRR